MRGFWTPFDQLFFKDEKTEEIGEQFGPAGPLVMVALICNAKVQGKYGKVDGTYRDLAHDTHIEREEAAKILKALVEIGFAEGKLNGRNYNLFLPAFKRWNDRQRKQEQRERERAAGDDVTACHTKSKVSQKVTKNRTEQNTKETTSSKTKADVEAVYKAWVEATNRPGTALTEKRRKLIRDRLRDYSVEDLIDAVRGIGASRFHAGENDRRKRFNDIEIALRDGPHIERFRDEFRGEGLISGASSLDYDPLIDA